MATFFYNQCPIGQGGGATEPHQISSWVSVFNTHENPPSHLASMVVLVTVLHVKEVTASQLFTMVVTVLQGNQVTPPQLSTMVVTVL